MPSDSEPRTEWGLFLSNGLEAMGFSEADAYEAIVAIETEAARLALEDVAERADDVRYVDGGGNGTSNYWRGFNDGIDKFLALLSTPAERIKP